MNTINCKGKLIDLSTPKVMGILNITPDSFYDGGKYKTDLEFLNQSELMLKHGATWLDLGAYSSRPGAKAITEEEELNRLLPILESILKKFPTALISVDTFRSKVADQALDLGAAMINDISAGSLDDQMFKTIAKWQVPYVMMHMKGTPQNMQQQTDYGDLFKEIYHYFSKKIAQLNELGVNDIIIDPGFGFSKTLEQNYQLLPQLHVLKQLGLPILVGVSRKSMLYKYLETTPEHALNATSVINTLALTQGANILRVHDVKPAMECIQLVKKSEMLPND